MSIESLYEFAEKRAGTQIARNASEMKTYPHVSTGIFVVDFALGGGVQENTITTIVGYQSSGKTSLTFRIIANFQKKYNGIDNPYKRCVFIDVEHTFDPVWASKHGVDLEKLVVIEPTDGDIAVDVACKAMQDDEVCLVVMDSIPALVTSKELEKSVGDHVMSPVATVAQRFLRKASEGIAIGANTGNYKTLLLINQWRWKIGGMHPEKTMPGGNAPRFFVSTEIEIMKEKKLIEGANEDGVNVVQYNEHSFKLLKNKTGNSIVQGDFEIARTYHDGYEACEVMDDHTVHTYAGKYGLAGGGGAKYWLTDPRTGEVLSGKKGELTDMIKADKGLKEALSLECIKQLRKRQGQSENPYV